MATELRDQRRFLTDRREVAVFIKDDFGHVTPHTISLVADKCSYCGQVIAKDSNGVTDVEATVQQLCEQISDQVGLAIDKFAGAGMDVSQIMAVRQERLDNIAASKTIGATSTPAADAGTAQGG